MARRRSRRRNPRHAIQRWRDSRAALRMLGKLLKKQGFAPKLLVTTSCAPTPRRSGVSSLPFRISKGCGITIGRKTRIRQCGDASAKCSASSRLDPPSAFSACTLRFTTPSTCNATSSPDPHCGYSEQKLLHSGEVPSQQHDACRISAQTACSIELP